MSNKNIFITKLILKNTFVDWYIETISIYFSRLVGITK